jgi:hypothetical protein
MRAFDSRGRPEEAGAPDDLAHLPSRDVIGELHVERAYIGRTLVSDVLEARREVLCKPWWDNGKLFSKSDFHGQGLVQGGSRLEGPRDAQRERSAQ